ncbi:MAG: alpha/beta fold hydrolase, partial [Pseudonocardia sp.]
HRPLRSTHMSTVTSADGTTIAYERTGSGPTVVLVATCLDDRHGLDGIAALLASRCTVVNYDRRGRGKSGDVQPWAPAREVDDIAALLDAIGEPAYLVSGSGGCQLALDAASALGDRVAGLFLIDPPFIVGPGRPPAPADYIEHVDRLVAEDRRSDVVEYFFTQVAGVPAEYMEPMKADPSWQTMCRYAHTMPYDARLAAGLQDGTPLPTDRWTVTRPVRIVVGENSEPFLHEATEALAVLLPNARHDVLPGGDHGSFWMASETLAGMIADTVGAAAAHR